MMLFWRDVTTTILDAKFLFLLSDVVDFVHVNGYVFESTQCLVIHINHLIIKSYRVFTYVLMLITYINGINVVDYVHVNGNMCFDLSLHNVL